MLKAYKYRIYSSEEQKNFLAQHFGCARWVYNWALDKKQYYYKATKKSLSNVNSQNLLVALAHEKVANQRFDAAHQAFARLVYKSHDTSFVLDDLNIKGMPKNHKLARAVFDCGWRIFQNILEYKAKWSGKNVIIIDRWAALSSKTCSACGNKKDIFKLSERRYHCDSCGHILDRRSKCSNQLSNSLR